MSMDTHSLPSVCPRELLRELGLHRTVKPGKAFGKATGPETSQSDGLERPRMDAGRICEGGTACQWNFKAR